MSKRAMISPYFPEEILVEILYKLPVKSLGKCMCVSKAWNFLIKNPSFVSSHLNHQSKNNNSNSNNLLLVVESLFPEELQYSLRFDDQEFSLYAQAQLQQFPFGNPRYILGSCNGLLCFLNSDCGFILCNPIIRKCIRLPKPCFGGDMCNSLVGFGFDSVRNDYKLLKITCTSGKLPEVELYSLNRSSWKTLAPPKYKLFPGDVMVFVNGIVHCIAIERVNDNGDNRRKAILLGFDMSDDVFKEIVLPDSLSRLRWYKMYVVPYNELSSIAVIESVSFFECNIWVMKKYGMVETWTKMFNFETEGSMLRPMVLGFRKNGDLIIGGDNDPSVVVHDLESNQSCNFGIQGINGEVIFSYMESLVLLNQDASDDIDLVDKSTGDASSANDSSSDNSWNGQSFFSYELLEYGRKEDSAE